MQTAVLLANVDHEIDARAGFYIPVEEKSREIYEYSRLHNINFFEAAETYQNGALAKGIHGTALGLNRLIDEILSRLVEGEAALIVSHDSTIATAMALRGLPQVSSNYLSGYELDDKGGITQLIT